jgi:hypothetical protein
MADEVIKEGKSMMKDDDLIFLGDQETYHTWRFVCLSLTSFLSSATVLTELQADSVPSLSPLSRWAPLSTEDGTVKGLMINSVRSSLLCTSCERHLWNALPVNRNQILILLLLALTIRSSRRPRTSFGRDG